MIKYIMDIVWSFLFIAKSKSISKRKGAAAMIDIHCHLIFGADDGSDSIGESLEMAGIALRGGTRYIVATPHSNIPDSYSNYWDETLRKKFVDLNAALKESGMKIKVYPGQEIFCAGDFEELLKKGLLRTINGSRYPLVEFDFYEDSRSVYSKLSRLLGMGYTPIIAHPERYAFVSEDEYSPEKLRRMGCLLQINKGSLNGYFGRSCYEVSHSMLDRHLADFVASDAHSPYMRTPYLGDVHEMISEEYSADYAHLLLESNPLAVLNNKKTNHY